MLGASTKAKSLHLSGTYSYQPTDSNTGKNCVVTGDCDFVTFGGTDSPLSTEQQREMPNAWFLPSVAMAVAVGFHLPNVGDLELRIPREALAAIFLGRIRQWSELAEWNPELENVRQNIELVVRADRSVSVVGRWHVVCLLLQVVSRTCVSVVARCLLHAVCCTPHGCMVACCMLGQVGCQ
jgi:ABC-type phosphate transport system substrate-binding protein